MEKIWAFMHDGAPFSFVNVAILAFVLAIIVDRFVHILSKHQVNGEEFMAQIRKLVQAGNIDRRFVVGVVGLGAGRAENGHARPDFVQPLEAVHKFRHHLEHRPRILTFQVVPFFHPLPAFGRQVVLMLGHNSLSKK